MGQCRARPAADIPRGPEGKILVRRGEHPRRIDLPVSDVLLLVGCDRRRMGRELHPNQSVYLDVWYESWWIPLDGSPGCCSARLSPGGHRHPDIRAGLAAHDDRTSKVGLLPLRNVDAVRV